MARRFREAIAMVESVGADRTVEWRHGLQPWVGIGTDPDDGRTHVAKRMADFYKLDFAPFAKYTPTGTAEQIADYLRPFVDAGATTLNIAPCGASAEIEIETVARIKELLA